MSIYLHTRSKSRKPWWHGVDRRSPINPQSPWVAAGGAGGSMYMGLPWLAGGSKMWDATGRDHGVFTSGAAAPVWQPSGSNPKCFTTNATLTAYALGTTIFNSSGATVWFVGTLGTQAATGLVRRGICGCGQGSGGQNTDKVLLYNKSTGSLEWMVYSGSVVIATSPGSYVAGQRVVVVGTSPTSNLSRLYVDGSQVATASASGTYTSYGAPNLLIGGTFGNGVYPPAAFSCEAWGVFRTPLNAAAVEALTEDANDGWRTALWRPTRRMVSLPTTGSITGSSITTEDSDTVSAAGSVAIAGSSTTTEASDTLSATAAAAIAGAAATTDAPDTVAASGAVAVSGSHSSTEAADVVAATGSVAIVGSSSTTEDDDTVTASSSSSSTGSGVTTEDPDTVGSTGTVLIVGQSVTNEASDSVTAVGAVAIGGQSATTDAPDTVSGSGAVLVTGASVITDVADSVAAAGLVRVSGVSSTTEDSETVTAAGHNGTSQAASPFRSRFLRSSVLRGSKL